MSSAPLHASSNVTSQITHSTRQHSRPTSDIAYSPRPDPATVRGKHSPRRLTVRRYPPTPDRPPTSVETACDSHGNSLAVKHETPLRLSSLCRLKSRHHGPSTEIGNPPPFAHGCARREIARRLITPSFEHRISAAAPSATPPVNESSVTGEPAPRPSPVSAQKRTRTSSWSCSLLSASCRAAALADAPGERRRRLFAAHVLDTLAPW